MSKLPEIKNTKIGFVLGLTGGIATGKSTVSSVFKAHGYPIIDGDLIARQVVKPNTPGLKKLVSAFGHTILKTDQTLYRKRLGDIIFKSKNQRKKLDALLDPFIRTEIVEEIKKQRQLVPLVIVDIPLLYERKYDIYMDTIAVVYTTKNTQIKRLIKRNDLTAEEAEQLIASQWPIDEKKKRATIVFDNNGTKDMLVSQIETWLDIFTNRIR